MLCSVSKKNAKLMEYQKVFLTLDTMDFSNYEGELFRFQNTTKIIQSIITKEKNKKDEKILILVEGRYTVGGLKALQITVEEHQIGTIEDYNTILPFNVINCKNGKQYKNVVKELKKHKIENNIQSELIEYNRYIRGLPGTIPEKKELILEQLQDIKDIITHIGYYSVRREMYVTFNRRENFKKIPESFEYAEHTYFLDMHRRHTSIKSLYEVSIVNTKSGDRDHINECINNMEDLELEYHRKVRGAET